MTTALDKIKAIQKKAEEEIEALRREAASDLARKIAVAKAALKALEDEYEQVTGKPVRETQEVQGQLEGRKRAKKLDSAQKEALSKQVENAIKSFGKDGARIGEIIKRLKSEGVNVADNQLVRSIKEAKGISKEGEKAATVYSIK